MVDKLWLIQQIINYKDPHHEEEDPQNDIEPEQITKFIKQYEKESLEAYNQMIKETIEHNINSAIKHIEESLKGTKLFIKKYYILYSDHVKTPELFILTPEECNQKVKEGYIVAAEFTDPDNFYKNRQAVIDSLVEHKRLLGDTH